MYCENDHLHMPAFARPLVLPKSLAATCRLRVNEQPGHRTKGTGRVGYFARRLLYIVSLHLRPRLLGFCQSSFAEFEEERRDHQEI